VPPSYRNHDKRWTKTKGDIFEAYVAAVILSDPINGYQSVEAWLTALWLPKLATVKPAQSTLQFKEQLAKKVMGKGIKLKYVDERPPLQLDKGMQTFFVGVYLTGWGWKEQHLGSGKGFNKVEAGNQAANKALANKPLIDEIASVKQIFDKKN
jgi:ribonuclease III